MTGDVNPVALFITTALNIAIIPLMILGELAEQHSAQVLNITAVNT